MALLNNKTKNPINHALIENRDDTMIHGCRSYRRADANSDHTLVIAKIKEKLTANRKLKKERERVNVEILKDKQITQQIEIELNKRLGSKDTIHETIEDKWSQMKQKW
ncbi:hypothetical protein Zmor_021731 [Zophobas morio]|uniref:Uncharacterized protein n=1 Tax=Zophobas morio TaxID=2755281 RepID=A0AA38MB70_9CUCU|nr:hypothetical protein Zmor_021731 [Zophobas morio]